MNIPEPGTLSWRARDVFPVHLYIIAGQREEEKRDAAHMHLAAHTQEAAYIFYQYREGPKNGRQVAKIFQLS